MKTVHRSMFKLMIEERKGEKHIVRRDLIVNTVYIGSHVPDLLLLYSRDVQTRGRPATKKQPGAPPSTNLSQHNSLFMLEIQMCLYCMSVFITLK